MQFDNKKLYDYDHVCWYELVCVDHVILCSIDVVRCLFPFIHVSFDMIYFGIVGGKKLGFGVCCKAGKTREIT